MDISRRALAAHAAGLAALSACSSSATAPASVENTSDALGDLDATGIAARIRAREITALEALDAAIGRTERLNPELNFVIEKQYERARARAAEQLSGPFAGVPTLIKDLLPWTGVPTRYGSRAFANFVPDAQPPYTDALFGSGLNPFGKSTTPEFGLTATTEPLLGGPTLNPWDPTKSSGGSSGGAAVAVASRAVPIAHASDGGGSIRIPASCNGLFGLKVSRGRSVAQDRPQPFSISVSGCVSRSVRDTAAWLAVTEAQGAGAAFPAVGVVTGPSQRRLRIALAMDDAMGNSPDPEVRAATESVAQLCRSLGHEVRERRMEIEGQPFVDAFVLLWASSAAEVVASVRARLPRGVALEQVFEPLTLGLAEHFRTAGGEPALGPALARLRAAEQQYAAFFADSDVLLTPVLARTPPPIGELSPTLGMAAFDRVVRYVGYTPLQNVAGAPAMSVPLSWSPSGMPIGAHFGAAQGQERRLLELAYELEQAAPWSARKPQVNAG
ncbi:aspartyl-tRNA(Asn) amidotransferase subunit A [alpha proteobacterium U9-1i]|nr:aspartyl-tRNA(Asn) amidotransferase subunit A [alpha proteobacterium U9-1i]